MKRKFLAAVLAAAMAAGTTGCLSNNDSKEKDKDNTVPTVSHSDEGQGAEPVSEGRTDLITESMELMRLKYSEIPEISSGPVIKISDTTVKPGEIAAVTVSLTGADKQWTKCGIHMTYPDVLECQLSNIEELEADYEPGSAIKRSMGFVAMDWQNNLADELIRNKNRSLFFTAIFSELLSLFISTAFGRNDHTEKGFITVSFSIRSIPRNGCSTRKERRAALLCIRTNIRFHLALWSMKIY